MFSDTDLTQNNSTKQQQLLQQRDLQHHQKVSWEQDIEPVTDSMCVCVYHRTPGFDAMIVTGP